MRRRHAKSLCPSNIPTSGNSVPLTAALLLEDSGFSVQEYTPACEKTLATAKAPVEWALTRELVRYWSTVKYE